MRIIKSLLLACAFSFSGNASENTIQISQAHLENLGVRVGKLEPVKQIPVLYAPAKVVIPPAQEFIVSASQAGLLTRLNVGVGDRVKKGQILAQLNSPELLSLQRLYLKADSDLQLSRLSYQRDKKLLAEGVIADRRWQETRSQYNVFAAEANERRQLLEIAGMSDNDIKRLDRTRRFSSQLNVYAPVSGAVIERLAVVGTRIDILAPLYRIANLDELWLEINIPQERIGSINIGDQVVIENPAAGAQAAVKAEIALLGQSVNPENQTILARAIIRGEQTAVKAGQRINTRIVHASDKAVFKIPNAAIAQNEGKAFIFIRNLQGFLVHPVAVVGKQDDESIISDDFTGNEVIAVKGAVALKAKWLGLGGHE
ncbi:RND family efflux transporter MFP subunit [Candidatus Methylobacter favarea]|uniref:RND family efflux transporter MFP subunit n=1 Tax=Candidatus Methylobacter favarea TaxID=2707345 RepID=A0A8S0XH95_9GAMM|nr:efflux RND transporter periplasmic adaptor subunit [Candidatus Methylobacter favarea]CAA9889511.1 RND family efflux transporter MFP subunit [Candidatus Methylobacter favarea]